jgi:hypothetical protein
MVTPEDINACCREKRTVVANANDCNHFVKAVCGEFGITLVGSADPIIAQITGPGWTHHGTSGPRAAAAAAAGELVIGGMSSTALGDAHGHVVVVVDGPLDRDKYPTAYWGSLNPRIRDAGAAGTTINFSFSQADRDKVVYASRNAENGG